MPLRFALMDFKTLSAEPEVEVVDDPAVLPSTMSARNLFGNDRWPHTLVPSPGEVGCPFRGFHPSRLSLTHSGSQICVRWFSGLRVKIGCSPAWFSTICAFNGDRRRPKRSSKEPLGRLASQSSFRRGRLRHGGGMGVSVMTFL